MSERRKPGRPSGPRIRSVKPEHPQDERVGRLSDRAYRVWMGFFTLADDEGRFRALPSAIIGQVFPYASVTPAKLRAAMEEIEASRMVVFYEVDGTPYGAFRRWRKHQRIDKPTPSDLPPPPDPEIVAANAPKRPERSPQEDEDASTPDQGSAPRLAAVTPDPKPTKAEAREVFDAWIEATGKTGQTVFEGEREKLIRRWLATYPKGDLIDAVRGWRHSPHHRGENERHTIYNDLPLLLRHSTNIERFRDLERRARDGAGSGPRAFTETELRAMREGAATA